MGYALRQSRHPVTANRALHFGQTACVSKVSKGWPHWAHFQNAPIGGAVLQQGQVNPSRRGNFARRDKARACFSPPQQFIKMKKDRTTNQAECIHNARAISPATPMNPMLTATIRLRARPSTNQRRDRRIWFVLRSEEHTSELQSLRHLVCRLL